MDANPTGPEPVAVDEADEAEPEAEPKEPGEEGDFDPFGPDAARAARQSVKLSDYEVGVADETLEVLTTDSADLYQKDGSLVRVNRTPKEGSTVATIHRLSEANLREEITRRVHFYVESREPIEGEEKKTRKVRETRKCPNYLPKAIASRGEYPGVRPLDRIVTAPVFRADGSIVSSPGYDPESWTFHEPDADYPLIPLAPAREDAERALRKIMELVAEFPWIGERDKMVWLAGLLTLVGRDLFDGPSPLFALDGNQRGVGKGLLTDVAAIIATGRPAPSGVSMKGRDDDDELRKVIDSVAMSGSSGMLLFDNLSGPIGGAILDSAITSSRRAGRKLGGNETFDVESKIVYWANGNNLSTTGDSSRRALIARLSYGGEHASEGRSFAIEDLAGYVEANRPGLYCAAMTVLREFIVSGRPKTAKTLGSFEQWSWTIAACVARLTGIDPVDAVAYNVIDDPVDEANGAILAGLYDMLRRKGELAQGLTAKMIIARVKGSGIGPKPEYADLEDALSEIAPGGRDLPSVRILGNRLAKMIDRPIGGLTLRKAGNHQRAARWTVEAVDPLRRQADSGYGPGEAETADTIPFATAAPPQPSSTDSGAAGEAAR